MLGVKTQSTPKKPQFSLKLYPPLFYMNPNGSSYGLSFPTSYLRARDSLACHLRRDSMRRKEEQSESSEGKKKPFL